jgi:hypothetical protein
VSRLSAPLLYEALALIYIRLRDPQDAYNAAVSAQFMEPLSADPYLLMGSALSDEGLNEDATIKFLEGSIVAHDDKFMPLIRSIYASGLDRDKCAFINTEGQPTLNYSCPIVHRDICKASGEMILALIGRKQADLADKTKKRALTEYKCTPGELR